MTLVQDVMVHDVVAVAGDTSLDAVRRLFALHQISGAPVIDDDGRVVGVVSQADVIDPERPRSGTSGRTFYYRVWNGDIRATGTLLPAPAPEPGTAADVMSSPVLCIDHKATLDEAATRMLDARVHRLFVTRKGKIVGLVTALDCLRTFAHAAAAH